MDQSRIGNAVELGNKVILPASQELIMDQTSRILSNMRPETFNQMGVARPVHNYSMQTGEEFSIEFLRDGINSRTPFSPGTTKTTTVNTSGSMDVKNAIGGPIQKEFERGNSSLTEGKGNHSKPQTASVSPSSARMKILCSFGGQILPRPSDGNLRYVGGETRMIRISNDISWQNLKQKTMEIFKQTHIIRYQLPGEDLDALVSVSCDDDLQNMVEEGKDLEGVDGGSKKLRMFLFSLSDLEDANYSLVSAGSESVVNYVVAVNGMELGSRKQSLVNDLPSTLENNLKEVDEQHFERYVDGEAAALPGISTPKTGIIASSSTIQSVQSGQAIPSNTEKIHPHLNKSPNKLHTDEAISSHLEESSRHILLHGHTPQDGVTEGHQCDGLRVHQSDNADNDSLKTEVQESNSKKVFSLDNHPSNLSGEHEGNMVDHITVEEALITKSVPERTHVLPVSDISLLKDNCSSQHSKCDNNNNEFISTETAFLPSCTGFDSDLIDLSNNDQPALHQRVFYSEKIPRDQAAVLNRLSKSDHSLDSQLLKARPHSDNLWQDSISESIETLQNRTEAAETEEYFLFMKSLHTEPPTVNQGLEQLQSYKMLADEISKTDPKHSGYMPELNHEEYVSNSINNKGVMNDDRALQTNPETFHEDSLKKCSLETGEHVEGGSKQFPMKQEYSVKHQEDPATSLPELDWTEIGGTNHTGDSDFGLPQPSVVTDSSILDVPRVKTPLDVLSMQEREDLLVDIDGRASDDILSDMFSKSVLSNNASGFGQLNIDGVGLSVNMQNYEPKRWSYFQKLAQNQSLQKEMSLIDQDHLGYPYDFPKSKNEGLKSYDFTPLRKDGTADAKIDSGEDSPREYLQTVGADITVDPVSNYDPSQVMSERELETEKQIRNIGLPPADPFAGDSDFSSLQVIKNGDLEELKELGSGTFGTVYHGKWRGTDVAIKRIKNSCFTGPSSEQEKMSTFWGEADIISKLHHPNVVAFYGVVQDGPGGTLATVVEFMVDGSLRHVLLRKDRYLDRHKRLLIAMDAAFGMEYLHSKNIIHFDLKCDNLLVNLKDPLRPICKVGDFGLSKIRRNTLVSGGIRGTLPWMAPELLNGSSNKVSEKVDVFSFGIVLWEILTGEEPYANMHYGAILGGIANNTLRPVIPSYCDDDWKNLMEQCWASVPADRPSFSQIATRLRTMSAASPTKVQPNEKSKIIGRT